ncbi:MAG: hypothetical protein ACFB6R_18390 [Alphaproteobacteria bacterium]
MDTPITTPVRSGFALVPGSIGLIALRILATLAAIAPAMLAAWGEATAAARSAFFSEAPLPMGAGPFFDLFGQVMAGAGASLPVVLVLALIFKLLLDGGAMAWFTAQATGGAPGGFFGFWRTVFGEGWRWFWAMLRIALVPVILLGAGLAGLAFALADAADPAGLPADRTAFEIYVLAPGLGGACLLVLSWLTGALALHMRAVSVVNGRRNTAVALWRGLGILVRRPFQATLLYVLVTGVVALASAALVLAWRDMDPRGEWLWALVGLWAFAILVQAYVWHGLTRGACLLSLSRDHAPAA